MISVRDVCLSLRLPLQRAYIRNIVWVNHPNTTPELLFIRRSSPTTPASASSFNPNSSTSRWSSHIAFPGGRHEPADESALYTALRETWEEIGIDLAEKDFIQVGRLDEREITTSLGKRLLMILSPFGKSSGVPHGYEKLTPTQSFSRLHLSHPPQNLLA